MGISQLSSHVESEVATIVNDRVAYFDCVAVTTLYDLLLKQWFNCWVELLTDILNHYRIALTNGCFKELQILFLRKLHDLDAFLLSESSDPLVCLTLWVNKEWPSLSLRRNDSVFN